ncbi:hypothetical protein CBF23_002090 [Marinomonas agarivorans]|nr:hypothetical protein CBF23_002090 [Marinomonas agarivorans]
MLSFLVRHSLPLMFVMALLGFLLPDVSLALFPFLPYVLLSLMTLTMLGIKQSSLLKEMRQARVWGYALFHSFGLMSVSYALATVLYADVNLTVAMVAVAATGSLFGTPAIVRALGFDMMAAMAMTIASTLLLPVAIYVLLMLLKADAISLDMQSYFQRLMVFILGPMLLSFVLHAVVPRVLLGNLLQKISPYTILLVFAFPFGLIGPFRFLWDQNPMQAYYYLMIGMLLLATFFTLTYVLYSRRGDEALVAAITSGNRNVLLTYSIAGALLGPAFLPLAGAIQAPTYFLPMLTKWLVKRRKQKCSDE